MKKLFIKSISSYGIEIIGVIFMLFTASFLSNKLSLADYGSYAILSLLISWLEVIIIGGLSRASLYQINNSDKKLKTSKTVLHLYMITGLVMITMMVISYPACRYFLKIPNLYIAFPLICIYAFISAINNGFRQIAIVILKTDAIILPNLIKHFSKIILIYSLISWQANYINCIVAITLSSFFTLAYYYSKIGFLLNFKFTKAVIPVFKFAIPLIISTLFLRIFDIVDVMLINFFKGPTVAAIYSPAHSIKLMFSLLVGVAGGMLYSERANVFKKNGLEGLRPFLLKTVLLMIFGSLFLLPANHFIQIVLIKIYNEKFKDSLHYTLPILTGSYLMLFNAIFQVHKLLLNKRKLILITSVLTAITFTIVCSCLLFYNYPIVYISYAFLIICLITTIFSMVQIFNALWLNNIKFNYFLKIQVIKIQAIVNDQIFYVKELLLARALPKQTKKFKMIYQAHQGKNASFTIALFPYKLTFCTIDNINAVHKDDMIICSSISHYENLLARNLYKPAQILAPHLNIVALCEDKIALINHFTSTVYAKNFPKIGVNNLPLVLKKKIDHSSKNTYFISNTSELEENTTLLSDPSYYTQEYIVGDKEYSFHPLVIDNKIVSYVCIEFQYDTQTPIALKTSFLYRRKVTLAPKHVSTIENILKAIDYNGFCCVDFKIQDHELQIFEINPRLGYNARPYIHTYLRHLQVDDQKNIF
ncbi:MAG: hypothetical protein RL060_87 [Bacteroidota bacterium]